MILGLVIVLVPAYLIIGVVLFVLLTTNVDPIVILTYVPAGFMVYAASMSMFYFRQKGMLSDKLNGIPFIFNFHDGTVRAYTWAKEPFKEFPVEKVAGLYIGNTYHEGMYSEHYPYEMQFGESIPMPNGQTFRKILAAFPAPKDKAFRREGGLGTVSAGLPVTAAGVYAVFDVVDMTADTEAGFEGEPVPVCVLGHSFYHYLLSLYHVKLMRPTEETIQNIKDVAGRTLALSLKLENRDLHEHLAAQGANEPLRKEREAERMGKWVQDQETIVGTRQGIKWSWKWFAVAVGLVALTAFSLWLAGVFH